MKKIILILLTMPLFVSAQKGRSLFDSITVDYITVMKQSDSTFSEMRFDIKDSTITIEGDTTALIWMLVKAINDKDSIIRQREKVIQAAVDHTNMVSDYFKTKERKWPQYQALLKQMGYTVTKRKK